MDITKMPEGIKLYNEIQQYEAIKALIDTFTSFSIENGGKLTKIELGGIIADVRTILQTKAQQVIDNKKNQLAAL